jgi:anti-sigma factor RsiW
MLTCTAVERLLVRFADGASLLGEHDRRELGEHLESCPACRATLDDQRYVARVLHDRPQGALPAEFAAQIAARLEPDPGWLGLANWRAWAVSLAPVSALLVLLAWLGPLATSGSEPVTGSKPAASAQSADTAQVTLETWAAANAGSASGAVLLQPMATGDSLLEAVLTGPAIPTGERRDVR